MTVTPVPQSRASEAAIQAAERCPMSRGPGGGWGRYAVDYLEAAHDPALGLDRSVCLRDVVEWLRSNSEDALNGQGYIERADEVADEIERTFTASSSSEQPSGGLPVEGSE